MEESVVHSLETTGRASRSRRCQKETPQVLLVSGSQVSAITDEQRQHHKHYNLRFEPLISSMFDEPECRSSDSDVCLTETISGLH